MAGCVAMAAFGSEGSMVGPEYPPMYPKPTLTAELSAASIMMAGVVDDAETLRRSRQRDVEVVHAARGLVAHSRHQEHVVVGAHRDQYRGPPQRRDEQERSARDHAPETPRPDGRLTERERRYEFRATASMR